MKKILIILLIILALVFPFSIKSRAVNEDLNLTKDAKSAILIEPTTLEIIYAKNEKEKRSPASMTKIVTLILIMESLEKGLININEKVIASEKAKKITGSRIYLEAGEEMTIHDLLKGIAIGSGNDAAIAMAEKIAGSEENFVRMMNQKAKEIGAANSNFTNSHGLDGTNHYSCAYDMALFGAYLVNHYGDTILKYTSVYEDYLRTNTDKPFWLVNTNKLVRFIEGVDGIKSGWTDEAGYCLTGTIFKNNMRFISVTMGNSSSKMRNQETMQMLNYALSNYEIVNIFKKGQVVRTYKDVNLTSKSYQIVVANEVNILKKKGTKQKDIRYDLFIDYGKIKNLKNKDIGNLKLYYDNQLIKEISLDINEEVRKSSFIDVCFIVFKEIFLVSK